MVCITGKSSSQFLVFRFRNEFGVYINRLEICSLYEFEQYDLSDIDYVFTTVPIQTSREVSIYEISNFLDDSDVPRVRRQLASGDVNFLKKFYRQELFFPHVHGENRQEIIQELCRLIQQNYPLPEGFYESVWKRELMGSTDFGNGVAIPHPENCLVQENIACVGILDKPVLWSRNKVQVVVLTAIYESTSAQTQKFYQLTSALLSDSTRIRRIVSRRSYPHFMKLLLE
ncbi:MAG: PTS sugar transporter subunit IIA [Oscillospiraceae bacterium]|nr:PTS sugar transporter subunit IIA [Oscillospiraceae bacterium]